MNRKLMIITAFFSLLISVLPVLAQTGANKPSDWQAVEQALGRSGQQQADGAYKFGLPRGDLNVTVAGVQVKPALALGSWLAFSSPGQDAMLMGDLVLTE